MAGIINFESGHFDPERGQFDLQSGHFDPERGHFDLQSGHFNPNMVILTSKMVTLTQIMLAGIKFRPEFYARVTDFRPGFGLSTRVSVLDVPFWRFRYVYFGLSARFRTFGQVSDFRLEFRFRLRFRISAKVSD